MLEQKVVARFPLYIESMLAGITVARSAMPEQELLDYTRRTSRRKLAYELASLLDCLEHGTVLRLTVNKKELPKYSDHLRWVDGVNVEILGTV